MMGSRLALHFWVGLQYGKDRAKGRGLGKKRDIEVGFGGGDGSMGGE